MNHIPKKEWMGCAVATAAMLADLSYDEVRAHWPDLNDAQMRWPRDLCALLESVTETSWKLSECWHVFVVTGQAVTTEAHPKNGYLFKNCTCCYIGGRGRPSEKEISCL